MVNPLSKNDVFKCVIRDRGICQKCNKELIDTNESGYSSRMEIHHIIPISKGGSNSLSNLITLCHDCHMKEHGYNNTTRKTNVTSRVKKVYKPSGNNEIGHGLHIPSYAEIAKGYHCLVKEDGTLIYSPSTGGEKK